MNPVYITSKIIGSIQIYPQTTSISITNTTTITYKPKKPHFSIGIQAGYGISITNNQVRSAPYVGIGISY